MVNEERCLKRAVAVRRRIGAFGRMIRIRSCREDLYDLAGYFTASNNASFGQVQKNRAAIFKTCKEKQGYRKFWWAA